MEHSEQGSTTPSPFGLYVHVPFCAKKCPYCDFNTYAGLESLHTTTIEALCTEMQQWSGTLAERPITTIFLGGGTPTILEPEQLEQLFSTIYNCFSIAPHCEITSEVNPGNADRHKFHVLRSLGVNRLSIGVQSFQQTELQFLGRVHDVADVERAFAAARAAQFDNINLDFMFGLPGQSNQPWSDTLHRALTLAPEHLSLYSLIVEPNTPLHHWVERGRVQEPDEDVAAELYTLAMEVLDGAGYTHYEVSNWAKTANHACQHNLVYWRNQEYLGIGPGAHSHMAHRRWGNRRAVPGYIKRVRAGEPLEEFSEELSQPQSMGETMMLGLRLVQEGVSFERFQRKHQVDLRTIFAAELEQLTAWDLLELDEQRVRLTPAGLMVGNQVFMRFLPNE